MTPTPKAIENAARKVSEFHASSIPSGWDQRQIDEALALFILSADLGDMVLVPKGEVEKLRSALKGLSDMYALTWDRVDGGLMMMDSGVERFEKAHQAAYEILNPDAPLITDDEEHQPGAMLAAAEGER